jgi:hypothetical protein
MKKTLLLHAIRPMLGAHRIIRAESPEIDGILQMSFDSTSRLNQPPQRAF